jgi:hypothetical protein
VLSTLSGAWADAAQTFGGGIVDAATDFGKGIVAAVDALRYDERRN